MERKESSISNFQAVKENSIKLAGSMRDATQIIISYPELLTNPELREKIKAEYEHWLEYFYATGTEKKQAEVKKAKDDEIPF